MQKSAGFLVVATLLLALAGCRESPTHPGDLASASGTAILDGSAVQCRSTGTGLTAVVVNEDVIGKTIDVGDCDVGAYFNTDGRVERAAFERPHADGGPAVQYAVRVEGADVDVTGSEIDVVDDYASQFIGIGYRSGATGEITDNTVTGFHRVGVLLDGAGTSAAVERNVITGVGEKSAGWAENGIQVSRGGTATVTDNEIRGHWWDRNDFNSSGIIVFGSDEVTVQHNTLRGNDLSLALVGDRNNAVGNSVTATAPDGSGDGIIHYGAYVAGEGNGLRQNDFTTATGADFGIYVTGGSANTKLIRNTFSGGFGLEIVDAGEGTKLPAPFEP